MSRMFAITKDDINSKSQFITALRKFLHTGKTTVPPDNGREYHMSPGESNLVEAIADYFEAHTEIADKESGISFFYDLHTHLADAFYEFRTHAKHQTLRQVYKGQTNGDDIPDLFDIRHGQARNRVLYDLGRLMPLIAGRMGGEWLEHDLKGYFECQERAVKAAWRVFVRHCYRQIAPVIKASNSRVHKGLFGRTNLEIYTIAGRAQYVFERMTSPIDLMILDQLTSIVETSTASVKNKYAAIEALLMTRRAPEASYGVYEIAFTADDSDMHGFRAGMNTPGSGITDYKAAIDMIEDVVAHWDRSKLVEADDD